MPLKHLWRKLVVFLLGILVVGCTGQSGYPNRPINLICPWSAGGGSDRVARQLGAQLERELGVPVNVINATGGAGVTGHTRGALARPDGYTITLVTAELNMLHWRGLTNITYRDYRPIMQVNRDDAALFVRSDAPWQTVQELQDAIQIAPGELRASGTAFGGIWHVALAGWLLESGLQPDDVIWISINGSAPSLQELMAGGVEMVSCSIPEAQSLLDAGRIRCLAVMADQRSPRLPDVPTLKELGVAWTARTWRGLAAPNNLPDDRFRILLSAVGKVVSSREYQTFLQQAGFGYAALPPAEFERALEQEDARFGQIFRSDAFQSVRSQRFGPMLFPTVLLALGGVTLLLLLLTGNLGIPESAQKLTTGGLAKVGLAVGAVILYILLADHIGYIPTMALILAGLFAMLKVRWYVALSVIVVLVPLTYQLFAVYLRVPLPWGWIGW